MPKDKPGTPRSHRHSGGMERGPQPADRCPLTLNRAKLNFEQG
jgi:hypothetical protein